MPDRLEFCPRCGSGPRHNDPHANPETVCPDCGYKWPGAPIDDLRIPRRNRLDLAHPTELRIREAREAVEGMGADVRLTRASNLLGEALNEVADFIEGRTKTERVVLFKPVTPIEPTRYGFGLRRVRWPFWRFDATRTAFDLHVFVGSWWLTVPFFRHPLS